MAQGTTPRLRSCILTGVLVLVGLFLGVSCQSYGWFSDERRIAGWISEQLHGTLEALTRHRERFGTYPKQLSELAPLQGEESLVLGLGDFDAESFPIDYSKVTRLYYGRIGDDSFVLGVSVLALAGRTLTGPTHRHLAFLTTTEGPYQGPQPGMIEGYIGWCDGTCDRWSVWVTSKSS